MDTRLYNIAQDLLTNISQGLEDEGIDVPIRRYIHNGDWAADLAGEKCVEQFIVAWNQMVVGVPPLDAAGGVIKCSVPLTAAFSIVLLRCVPVVDSRGYAPTPEALNNSGQEIQVDAMTLAKVIVDKQLDGSLLDDPCRLLGLVGVGPYGPSGGAGGTIVDILVSLV